MCHLVLLLPVFGLVVFWIFPLPVAAPIYLFILTFSVWMYRSIMRAMSMPVATGSEGLVGQIGDVIDLSGKYAQLLIHGEVWKAESPGTLRKGERVKVLSVDKLTLRVVDANAAEARQALSCHTHGKWWLLGLGGDQHKAAGI